MTRGLDLTPWPDTAARPELGPALARVEQAALALAGTAAALGQLLADVEVFLRQSGWPLHTLAQEESVPLHELTDLPGRWRAWLAWQTAGAGHLVIHEVRVGADGTPRRLPPVRGRDASGRLLVAAAEHLPELLNHLADGLEYTDEEALATVEDVRALLRKVAHRHAQVGMPAPALNLAGGGA